MSRLEPKWPAPHIKLHEKSAPEANSNAISLWFLIYDFLTDRKSSIFGVRAAPGGRETFQKGGGLRFGKVSRPPEAA